jgi:hypothetical protein
MVTAAPRSGANDLPGYDFHSSSSYQLSDSYGQIYWNKYDMFIYY